MPAASDLVREPTVAWSIGRVDGQDPAWQPRAGVPDGAVAAEADLLTAAILVTSQRAAPSRVTDA